MANQNTNEPTPIGKLFGVVGLVTGFMFGWNSTQHFWTAVICGLVVGALGVAVGNFVHKLLIITVSILLMIGTSYCRREVFTAIRDGSRQSQTTGQAASIPGLPASAPTSARVIAQRANLRPQPTARDEAGNTPLAELETGERLRLLSPDHNGKGWYRVRHVGTGQEGWIHGNNIALE